MEKNIEKIKITLDGKDCRVNRDITILEAARQHGIYIPTLCHHPAVSAYGGCRLCMVEVDGAPRLAASCVTPVRDGMEVVTSNGKIIESRRIVLEFLFSERNHNCMFCGQSGDCELQNLAYEMQMDHLSVFSSFDEFPIDITNEYMALDHNRCILCGRCIRACREITGAHVLDFVNRGAKSIVSFDLNETRENSTCFKCGVCMEICPTGAIFSRLRPYSAVKGHDKKKWRKIESICPVCGMLCPTESIVSDNTLLKVNSSPLGIANKPDGGQLCCRGRFDVLASTEERLVYPMMKNQEGNWQKTGWKEALGVVAERFNHIRDSQGGKALFGIAAGMYANENLLLFKELMIRGWKAGYVDTFDGAAYRSFLAAQNKADVTVRESAFDAIAGADAIFVFGSDCCRSHPIIPAMITKSVMNKGAKAIVVGDEEHHLPKVHHFLPVPEEGLPLLASALLKKVLDLRLPTAETPERKKVRESVRDIDPVQIMTHLGLDKKAIITLDNMANLFASAVRPMIVTGNSGVGEKDSRRLLDIIRLASLASHGDALPLIIAKPNGNSVAAWRIGTSSQEKPPKGNGWKAGFVLTACMEDPPREILDGFEALDFLVVAGPFVPKGILARKAEILLPSPTWMEEDGDYASMDGKQVVYKKKILDAPDGVSDCREMLLKLAEHTGAIFQYNTPDEIRQFARQRITGD